MRCANRCFLLLGVAALFYVSSLAALCFWFHYSFGAYSGGPFSWLTIIPARTYVTCGGWAVWVAGFVGVVLAGSAMKHKRWRSAVEWSSVAVVFGLIAATIIVTTDFFMAARWFLDKLVVPFFVLIAASIQLIGSKLQSRRRTHCVECGYDLQGNESGTCPECGTIFAGEPRR